MLLSVGAPSGQSVVPLRLTLLGLRTLRGILRVLAQTVCPFSMFRMSVREASGRDGRGGVDFS